MKVILSQGALASMQEIRRRLAMFSESAASSFTDSMERRLRQLEIFPYSGRTVPEYGSPLLREVVEPPYRIVYEVFPDRVEIVIIRHGREHIETG
jgi:plasmid stabilization system protein ParE